jgi:hypothetical protein
LCNQFISGFASTNPEPRFTRSEEPTPSSDQPPPPTKRTRDDRKNQNSQTQTRRLGYPAKAICIPNATRKHRGGEFGYER